MFEREDIERAFEVVDVLVMEHSPSDEGALWVQLGQLGIDAEGAMEAVAAWAGGLDLTGEERGQFSAALLIGVMVGLRLARQADESAMAD